jgi:hypothetical protein
VSSSLSSVTVIVVFAGVIIIDVVIIRRPSGRRFWHRFRSGFWSRFQHRSASQFRRRSASRFLSRHVVWPPGSAANISSLFVCVHRFRVPLQRKISCEISSTFWKSFLPFEKCSLKKGVRIARWTNPTTKFRQNFRANFER